MKPSSRHTTSRRFSAAAFSAEERTWPWRMVSLVIGDDRPSITVVAGESGSGKTTLARLLLGIIHPTSGDILYQGKRLHEMSRRERRVFRREVPRPSSKTHLRSTTPSIKLTMF